MRRCDFRIPPRASGALVIACAIAAAAIAGTVADAQSLPSSLQRSAARLPPATRAELERHRAVLAGMDASQRDDFLQRIAAWDAQTPAVQRERREAWQAWQALPDGERTRLQAAERDFLALPADRQLALRARFDALDGSERRGWMLGPVLGAEWTHLHPLFAQVPPSQRRTLLAALRAMTPEARADLAVLAQRTPPQDRDALRSQWLAVPAERRGAWLRERLQR